MMAQAYFERAITTDLLRSISAMPAVFLNGPRQAGKSTLVQHIAKQLQANYVTFDDATVFSAASNDPENWLRSFDKPVIIDEVQLVPDLFRVLKKRIDEIRLQDKANSAGRFLLTGSANILTLPALADALVGRMQIFNLYPLAACESFGRASKFIDITFEDSPFKHKHFSEVAIEQIIANATFPELASNSYFFGVNRWFESYLSTLLQRDVKALAEIEKLSTLPHILQLLAARAGGLLNDAALARDAGLNVMTYRRYRTLFNQLFIILTIPPWYRNIGKRLVKSPKVYLSDTFMLCHLLGLSSQDLKAQRTPLFGSIVENFVATELTKQLTWQDGHLYHYRSQDNQEIDFIIERRSGQLVAIEVKARSYVTAEDFKSIKTFQSLVEKDFVKGIVLYMGKELISFGKNLYAVPISALWE